MMQNVSIRDPHPNSSTRRQPTAFSWDRPINIHCDIDQLIEEFEVVIWSSEFMSLVDDETIPILAIYAVEYMITRSTKVLGLISTLCVSNWYRQKALVDIFRMVVDNHGYLLEQYHNHFDIYNHYVYLRGVGSVAIITLQDNPDESAVALISPVDDDQDEDVF